MSAFSVRDAPFGQLCRLVFGPKVFLYPDEKEGFQYQAPEETPVETPTPQANSSSGDTDADVEKAEPESSPGQSKPGLSVGIAKPILKTRRRGHWQRRL